MCARYLVRKGSAWTFQIRLPADLTSDSILSRIRIPLGSMTALEARQEALFMAAAAQVAFRKVRAMDKHEYMDSGAARTCETMIRSLAPFFAGLDAMAETADKDHDPAVVDQVFDVLAQIGHDQSSGRGLFANPDLHPEASFVAALKSPPISRVYSGAASLDGLNDTTTMLSTIQSLSSRLEVDTQGQDKGELFSAVANGRIQDIKSNKAPDHELVRTYAKVRDEFIALCGDRRVGEYRRKDLQHYVDEISWLPFTASRQEGFCYKDVPRYIEANKAAGGRGLAVKTIREGRVAYIKAVIAIGCEDADIRNPIAKCRISIPDRAPLPEVRIAPDGKTFE